MDEVGVGGDGVNLAALGLEGVVVLSEFLELGGAYESEVCGIEEEQGPVTKDVGLGNGLELVILEGLNGEVADLASNLGHGELLCSS